MIHINNDYAIQADANQYILVKKVARKSKETGETSDGLDTIGYYRTMPDALEALSRRLHREKVQSDDMTLEQAVQAYRDVRDTVMGIEA